MKLKFAVCVLVVALSAALLWFGTGLHPIWWLTWIASIPVLLASARVSWRMAFLFAIAAWAIGGLNQSSYLHGLIGLPWQVALLADLAPALIFAIAVAVWRILIIRGMPLRAAAAFASVWVCYEFGLQKISVNSTFGSLAYTQMDFLPVVQIASVAGVAGISFILFFIPGAVAALLSRAGTRRDRLMAGVVTAALVIAISGWGTWRLLQPLSGPHIQVGLAASDRPQDLRPRDPEQIRETFRQYAAVTAGLITAGARLMVLPEKNAVISGKMVDATDEIFGAAARRGAIVAVGAERWTPHSKLNEIRIYTPDGRLSATYEKHHMLPAFESYLLPGTTLTMMEQPSGMWGMEICKDMDFPSLSRAYGRQGTGLLIVPAWDFDKDGWYHGRMAILRGVESGFSIVRAPKQGVLTVSDDRGRVLAQRITNASGFVTLLANVPVHHERTLYDRWDDWFGWFNIALLAGVLLSAFFSAKNARASDKVADRLATSLP